MAKKYWLMKSEPDAYSIDDLERDGETTWDGIRNYQARNYMRDEMKVGDEVLFYHSRIKPMGVVGLARVCAAPHADHTQFDKKSRYFDPKSSKDDPTWVMVDVAFVEKFADCVTLAELKAEPKLEGMLVTKRGQRLSIQPVEAGHFKQVCKMGRSK